MSTVKVPCPQCKKKLIWSSDNPHRPFCCERCKLIDLGAWASGDYQIAAEMNPDEEEFSTGMVELSNWRSPTIH
ncbi:MAG: DNA gyrase inhibitor YacG [Pseudomonadales bacterium]|nr:DNA gyrase inhibitor YacG [Pseudomonadales bacterium]NRA16357.1 DNA gyrase inhibitor YacG [Oceanospirillaceae bacterium]